MVYIFAVIEIKNIQQVSTQLDAWILEAKKLAEEVAKGLATTALDNLLANSAQFSGDFAANWNVIVNGSRAPTFTPFRVMTYMDSPFIMGNSGPIAEAKRRNAGTLDGFQLGDYISLENVSSHDQAYAQLIEDNRVKFRQGNTGRPVAITYGYMSFAFKDIDPSTARTLARKKL